MAVAEVLLSQWQEITSILRPVIHALPANYVYQLLFTNYYRIRNLPLELMNRVFSLHSITTTFQKRMPNDDFIEVPPSRIYTHIIIIV